MPFAEQKLVEARGVTASRTGAQTLGSRTYALGPPAEEDGLPVEALGHRAFVLRAASNCPHGLAGLPLEHP